jgi:hypothetical protein
VSHARAADVTRRCDNKDGGLRCANPPYALIAPLESTNNFGKIK